MLNIAIVSIQEDMHSPKRKPIVIPLLPNILPHKSGPINDDQILRGKVSDPTNPLPIEMPLLKTI